MTLKELLEIVREKRINAQNDLDRQRQAHKVDNAELKGERDAYLDIESLIEHCLGGED